MIMVEVVVGALADSTVTPRLLPRSALVVLASVFAAEVPSSVLLKVMSVLTTVLPAAVLSVTAIAFGNMTSTFALYASASKSAGSPEMVTCMLTIVA